MERAGRLSVAQAATVGVTLFSMFFGAGNLILPPLLGLKAGSDMAPAAIGFLITGIGLPILGIISVALAGTVRSLANRVHPWFSRIFVAAIYLSIGPCLAIPRTSSTSFEMLVPLLPPDLPMEMVRLIFSIAFFAVAFFFALRPGKLTRLLGRVTGPALIVLIVAVTVAAILDPAASIPAAQTPYDQSPMLQGFLTGYQTMDLLASLTFGIVIATNIQALGVVEPRDVAREISRAGAVAGALIGIIYVGFAFTGQQLASAIPEATNGAFVLTESAVRHFGSVGVAIAAAIFLLACLNVCIGLISCCATYFSEEIPGASYRAWAFGFALFSCAVSNVGLDAILTFSVPLLSALYPVSIVLVIMGVFHTVCDRVPRVWPFVIGTVAVISVAVSMRDAFAKTLWLPFDLLPFAKEGLGWVLPALVALAIAIALEKLVGTSAKAERASA
ncbi:branched-chain amino acid transport system II carrier protein [Collinsella sp. AGMB00827]|uniref:Branched-chain amino acid transport system II carrier protein n=1 Tax=Collinsella ureilytica TaxID=2869515 RepID=A0ABS7MJH0_9ACTN|nr:branched-chain amino acid transport system II carrier protein [Collinsella urealyticum]MBY4797521.1 branched-chain amino acid transport system II carrier protein [Collinsella urealyticum]